MNRMHMVDLLLDGAEGPELLLVVVEGRVRLDERLVGSVLVLLVEPVILGEGAKIVSDRVTDALDATC